LERAYQFPKCRLFLVPVILLTLPVAILMWILLRRALCCPNGDLRLEVRDSNEAAYEAWEDLPEALAKNGNSKASPNDSSNSRDGMRD
jgi:hypothetical protein